MKLWSHIVLSSVLCFAYGNYDIPFQTPSDCIRMSTGSTKSYYFDTFKLECAECGVNQTKSADGLKCVCKENYRLKSDSGSITCEKCPDGQVSSFSGWECVVCGSGNNADVSNTPLCPNCNVKNREIAVERSLTGVWNTNTRTCQTCANETWPNDDGTRCVRCNQVLSVIDSTTCICPADQMVGGVCVRSRTEIESSLEKLFKVSFGNSQFDSQYFKDNVQAAAAMCKPSYGNMTACQLLANLCVLILYDKGNVPTACSLYLRNGSSSVITSNWPKNLPWLYYLGDKTSDVLSDTTITTQFSFPNSILQLRVSSFSLNGTFLGYQDVRGGLLQMCKNSESFMNAAYVFGTTYKQTCTINVRDFWDTSRYPLTFYDTWLKFTTTNGKEELFAVPVLVKNFVDNNGKSVNVDTDKSNWQLVRRFFLVDNVSGRQADVTSDKARGVRYASSITLHVQLQPDQSSGRIIAPYIEISYDTAVLDDYNNNKTVKITFQVLYTMPLTSYEQSMLIAVAVLLSVGIAYSMVQTWGWSRRAGKIAIDFVTLIKFIAFACGNMANAFFVTTLGASIWWLIFFKRQSNVYLLVPDGTSAQFIGFLVAAFCLKLIQLIHLIICQAIVDIFLMDWERPPGNGNSKSSESTVSVWRTYFIANEWNEIQTSRRISPLFQYFGTVLILYVIGFGNLASMDPASNLQLDYSGLTYNAPMSSVLRFALIGIVYLLLALAQLLFYVVIYERFFEHRVQQFVDLCSMANISVFILENSQFGYYIHGRSVHGRADTNLREMHENFVREEKDLVSKRGLLPNSDEQSFEIAINLKMRKEFDRILQPVIAKQLGGAARAATRVETKDGSTGLRMLDAVTEKSIAAYHKLNNFLQLFIDHSLRDIDYISKPKLLFETLLGVEFKDPIEKCFFYSGVGLSFANVLFYGHEATLIVFELLFFSVIDLGSFNYVLNGIVLYVLMEIVVKSIRDGLGRSNLAKKTLVDKRFLI